MSEIKQILDEIASYSGKNDKRDCLAKHKDNELLQKVIYAANSPRINYHIKQIPEYNTIVNNEMSYSLDRILEEIKLFSSRELTGNAARNHLKHILINSHQSIRLSLN
jgi:hypothetical protein